MYEELAISTPQTSSKFIATPAVQPESRSRPLLDSLTQHINRTHYGASRARSVTACCKTQQRGEMGTGDCITIT